MWSNEHSRRRLRLTRGRWQLQRQVIADILQGQLMPAFYWFSNCTLVTAPISYSHNGPCSVHENSPFSTNMAVTFHNLCPDTVEGLGRRGEGRGSLPSPVSIVRGKCLIIPSRLAAIHRHPSCHHPSLWPISDGETKGLVAWGCVQTNMLEVGLGMDSLLCTHHFVWQQIVKVPAGPRPLAASGVPFRG